MRTGTEKGGDGNGWAKWAKWAELVRMGWQMISTQHRGGGKGWERWMPDRNPVGTF